MAKLNPHDFQSTGSSSTTTLAPCQARHDDDNDEACVPQMMTVVSRLVPEMTDTTSKYGNVIFNIRHSSTNIDTSSKCIICITVDSLADDRQVVACCSHCICS